LHGAGPHRGKLVGAALPRARARGAAMGGGDFAGRLQALKRRAMERRGDYGYDAPYALVAFAAAGTASLAAALVSWWNGQSHAARMFAFYAAFFLANAGSFFYTTRRGKFAVWEEIL